jgi:predicted O-methyltransferase YrrM
MKPQVAMDKLHHAVLVLCLLSGSLLLAQDSGDRPSRRGGFGPNGGGLMTAGDPVPKDDAEKQILQVLEELNRNRGIGVPRDDGRLLRMLVESVGAKHVVELGTFRGYSGIWICLGLRTTSGKLTTFEIDEENAQTARANFKRAGVDSLVNLIEGDAHKEVAQVKEPVDLVFIDADKEGYLDYLNRLLPVVRAGGLVVAHNIDPGRADPAFVDAITTNPQLDTIFVTTGSGGISLSLKKH